MGERDFLDNFLLRIKAINDRGVLLSIIKEFGKSLDESQLDKTEVEAVLRTFLERLKPAIFGLLTEQEFENVFGGVILKCKPLDTLISLIQALNSISNDDYFKLSKIVQLINFVIKYNFNKIFIKETSGINSKQLQGFFIQNICSFSDRIYNFYVDKQKNVLDAKKIVSVFDENLLNAMKSILDNENYATLNWNFYTKLLAFYGFLNNFVDWYLLRENMESSKIWPTMLSNPDIEMKKREQIVFQLISIKLLGDFVLFNLFFETLLTRKLLTERILSSSSLEVDQKRVSLKIVDYFVSISAFDLIKQTLLSLMQIFADQVTILESVNFEQQLRLALSILDFANNVRVEDYSELRDEVTNLLVITVPEYLKFAGVINLFLINQLLDISRRQIGMFLAETLTERFGSSSDKMEPLKFEYVSTDPIYQQLKSVVDSKETNSQTPNLKDPNKIMNNESITILKLNIDCRTQILDSDDDENLDEENIEALNDDFENEMQEFDEDMKFNKPFYIRNCLENLTEKQDYKTFAIALRHLPKLIEKKALGLDDLAMEIMDRIIFLEDKFNIPNFMVCL